MLNEYNPFSKKENEETEHGVLNYSNEIGSFYITHRRKEHFFKKYKGFAISNSELEIAYNRRIYWILIMYHKEDGTNEIYRMKMEDIKFLQEYNNNGDIQKIFPLKSMQRKEIGGWI